MNQKEFKHRIFALSEKLFPMVTRMLGDKEKAEDAIQEIMMKLWLKRDNLDKHPNLNGFVILTARNYCIDLLRKNKKNINNTSSIDDRLLSTYGHLEVEWEELNTIIHDILNTLPERQREVLMMRDLDGLEFLEIATVTNLKVEHVRVLLSRARKQVASMLKKIYSYERQ